MLSTDTQYCGFGSFCVSNPPRWNWDSDVAAYGNSARGWYIMGDVLGFVRFDLLYFLKVTKTYQKCSCERAYIPEASWKSPGRFRWRLATEDKRYTSIDVGRCPAWSHCQEVWKRERDDGVKSSGFWLLKVRLKMETTIVYLHGMILEQKAWVRGWIYA